jgi:hypothetical protein
VTSDSCFSSKANATAVPTCPGPDRRYRRTVKRWINAGPLLVVVAFLGCGGGNPRTDESRGSTTITLDDCVARWNASSNDQHQAQAVRFAAVAPLPARVGLRNESKCTVALAPIDGRVLMTYEAVEAEPVEGTYALVRTQRIASSTAPRFNARSDHRGHLRLETRDDG